MTPGVDLLGKRYAEEKHIPVRRMPADWNKHGKAAGPIRNEQMAIRADAFIAFWDGQSRGTANMIELAKKHNLKIQVVRYTPQ